MKKVVLGLVFVAMCTPAYAQLGGILRGAQKVAEEKKKLDDLNISEEDEIKIGQDVSAKIRQRFGVVQNADVHKYVTLVGTLLARQSERGNLQWTFIVLDTDGVNAFASPGGFVHITRGALGLIKSEAELAGVLAHEIGHVAHKHTVNAIRKNKMVQLGTSEALSDRGPFLDQLANKTYEMVLENSFDRGDELDADKEAVTLTQKVGYGSASLADFLTRLDDRNKATPDRNGLFASHPQTKERIDKIRQMAGAKAGVMVEARYKSTIKYEAAPITEIAVIQEGSAGLAGSSSGKEADKDKKQEEPKKKGFGLGALKPSVGQEQQSSQVSASGGARGIGADRAAKGGSNPNLVTVSVTDDDLGTFRKGIT